MMTWSAVTTNSHELVPELPSEPCDRVPAGLHDSARDHGNLEAGVFHDIRKPAHNKAQSATAGPQLWRRLDVSTHMSARAGPWRDTKDISLGLGLSWVPGFRKPCCDKPLNLSHAVRLSSCPCSATLSFCSWTSLKTCAADLAQKPPAAVSRFRPT